MADGHQHEHDHRHAEYRAHDDHSGVGQASGFGGGPAAVERAARARPGR